MINWTRYNWCGILLVLLWLAAGASVAHSLWHKEGDLEDPNTIALINDLIKRDQVVIGQQGPGKPLIVAAPGAPLDANHPPAYDDIAPPANSELVFNRDLWRRCLALLQQYTAAANWGLAEPFELDGRAGAYRATGLKSVNFKYQNPYEVVPTEELNVPVNSSAKNSPAGLRVVSQDLLLTLRPDAPDREETLGTPNSDPEGVLVARRILLQSAGGGRLRLSLTPDGQALVAQSFDRADAPRGQSRQFERGDYFLWEGRNFAVVGAGEPKPGQGAPGDLIFSKAVNGRLTRVHVLGEATANLLGARVRGRASFFDDAIRRDSVGAVSLTLVPELQAGSYYLLQKALEPIEIHPLGRPRRGSVTILDARTGAILADAGYPSFDTRWAQRRRVILGGDDLGKSPAAERHMVGSTVKVMTVAASYLLFGNAHSELLPPSDDCLAVGQAFQDVYGEELRAKLQCPGGYPTPEADARFAEAGGKARVKQNFLDVLGQVFQVESTVCGACDPATPQRCRPFFDKIVSDDLVSYFDERPLIDGLYPERSQFPALCADSMSALRNYALGADESRFTTLRLASVLGTAGDGKTFSPFIVESLRTRAGQQVEGGASAVKDLPLLSSGMESRRNDMIGGMRAALRKVIVWAPVGTGWFFEHGVGGRQYLGVKPGRQDDYGKSGTATYDEGRFEDSLFVYRHGDYLIAVWLERADGSEYVERAAEEEPHKEFERHPAHRLTDRIIRLLDSLREKQ